MKDYMVVTPYEGETSAHFYDDYASAHNYKMDVECGLGGYAEIYHRQVNLPEEEIYTPEKLATAERLYGKEYVMIEA